MNIRIEHQAGRAVGHGWWNVFGAILGIVQLQFGQLTVLLFVILFVSESIYRHLLHPGDSVKIGGIATLVGLGLLACAFCIVGVSQARYRKQSLLFADHRSYLTLTNDYLEREVLGLWQERIQWSALTDSKEHKSSFRLRFGADIYWLFKRELKTEAAVAEFRAFLAARAPGKPPLTVANQAAREARLS